MKLIHKRIFYFLSIYLIVIVMSISCMSFKESDRRINREFKKTENIPQIYRTNFNNKTLRYITAKPLDSNLPTLLFIHGAPGSLGNYFKYLKDEDLCKKANLIAVDRLGYGYSDYGNAEISIENQAESIYAITEKHKLDNLILIGWSYGAPIAAKMAFKYHKVKHSVLVAGAISPEDENFFGIAKLVRWKLTKWMFSKALKVSDKEKMSHVAELTKMLDDWQQIKSPITYYHGTKDRIVPYKNMEFIKSKVNDSLLNAITIRDANHFILSKKYEMVKQELLSILSKLK